MTGSIPGFIDVVLNSDSSALAEDNIVNQLIAAGKHIVFFGDDTWIKLFPHQFLRSDGTTSFYVNDYTEVGFNYIILPTQLFSKIVYNSVPN